MAALMVPQVLSFVQVEFPAKERPRAFAIYGMTFALGGVGGPLIGGLLTQADLFGLVWRPIFLINLPIGQGLGKVRECLFHGLLMSVGRCRIR